METTPRSAHGWEQSTMFPPDVVEITAKVGVMALADHVQFQIEVRDPRTGALLQLWSLPHTSVDQATLEVEEFLGRVRETIAARLRPF